MISVDALRRITCIVVLAWLHAPLSAGAADPPQPVAPKLTPKLKQLFAQEMQAILRASGEILTALTAGDGATVARKGEAIRASFILERNLTPQDRKDLMAAVPAAFLDLDAAFHETAAKLAQAAHQNDRELQNFYFGRMIETCQACHRRFATDKFPAFLHEPRAVHEH